MLSIEVIHELIWNLSPVTFGHLASVSLHIIAPQEDIVYVFFSVSTLEALEKEAAERSAKSTEANTSKIGKGLL